MHRFNSRLRRSFPAAVHARPGMRGANGNMNNHRLPHDGKVHSIEAFL